MILCIIQARMASSRLPGKVLLDIGGKPMLQWSVERATMAESVANVLVATTAVPSADPISAFCRTLAHSLTRGSLLDVLDRSVLGARACKSASIVPRTYAAPSV